MLGRSLDDSLAKLLPDLPHASDRGLAHALAGAALRFLPDLDQLIDSACARPLPPDSRARQVLRVALAGRLVLGTPLHAVVATALPLLEGGPRRLAHAVLSRLDREGAELPGLPTLPNGWAARWEAAFGRDAVSAMQQALAAPPPLDLRLRVPAEAADWAHRLGGQSLGEGHVRLPAGTRVESLPGYVEGAFWVQDLAAQQPVRLLGDVAGRRVLDLCAAPGGKTLQLASLGAEVTALDRDSRRMALLRSNLARTGLSATTICAQLETWEAAQPFDAVLLDAPCTATGTFRRHPDVLHRRRPADCEGAGEGQRRLLAHAARFLDPGGTLVYAVCSVEPEEGEGVIQSVAGLLVENARRLLPGIGPGDGFFIARLRKT